MAPLANAEQFQAEALPPAACHLDKSTLTAQGAPSGAAAASTGRNNHFDTDNFMCRSLSTITP